MTIDDYLALPYTRTLKLDHDDRGNHGYVAAVAELPGCVAQGDTQLEALGNLDEAMRSWLDAAVSSGAEIPTPREEPQYSGRVLLRMAASLHAELVRAAEAEGTSLNQFLVGALAGAVSWRVPATQAQVEEGGLLLGGYRMARADVGARYVDEKARVEMKKVPLLNFLSVDVLEIDAQSAGKLKGAGLETVGDLVKKSLNDYGVRLTGGNEEVTTHGG
jgi:predicted RNase H-like HicB family nuclease